MLPEDKVVQKMDDVGIPEFYLANLMIAKGTTVTFQKWSVVSLHFWNFNAKVPKRDLEEQKLKEPERDVRDTVS